MNRRKLLTMSGAVLAGALSDADAFSRERRESRCTNSHNASQMRLPTTDVHYQWVQDYVEETPDADYRHASQAALDAFRDLKFGVRIHWGIYSILGQPKGPLPFSEPNGPWDFLEMSNEQRQEYQDLYRTWNPTEFDAEQWMALFSRSGAKCFAFTTKHHDGFSMFDTHAHVQRRVNWGASSDPCLEDCNLSYSIMDTPFHRDVVRELCDAARRYGIRIDLYFSHADWYDADFRPYAFHPLQTPHDSPVDRDFVDKQGWGPESRFNRWAAIVPDADAEEVQRMLVRHRKQLHELLTRYGKIDMVCFDQWLGPRVWAQLKATIKELRSIQPDLMFRARGIGNYGDYYTPEGFVPDAPENTDMPWMTIYPLGNSFSYIESDSFKGAKWIIDNVVDAAAKGGNFMAGIGADPTGKFHPTAIAQLEEAGAWLRRNGEAIYATRHLRTRWKDGENVRFTWRKDGTVLYATSLKRPAGKLVLHSVRARPSSTVTLLGHGNTPVNWTQADSDLLIELPHDIPDALAYTFKVTLESAVNCG